MASLYEIKPAFVRSLQGLTDRLAARGVHPDTVTMWGALLGVLAGGALLAGLEIDALWFVAVLPVGVARLAANAIDGQLARQTGRSSSAGAVWNEVADRVGDAAMFAPLVLVAPVAGWLVLVFVFAAEWASMVDWAINGERRYVGIVGKPDRVIGLAAGALAAIWWPPALEYFTWVFAVALIVTTLVRLRVAVAGAA